MEGYNTPQHAPQSVVLHMPLDTEPPPALAANLIEQQLARIESSPLFSHSRRYPNFLNYVVRKALEGRREDLKERTIGTEVFGRPPEYDLNADPVVRVTAGEVRKRLAQYYYAPEHQEELRIELRPGSYIPEFKPAPKQNGVQASLSIPEPLLLEPPVQAANYHGQVHDGHGTILSNKKNSARVALVIGLMLLALATFANISMRGSALTRFWRPVLEANKPVLISVGSVLALTNPTAPAVSDASVGEHALHSDPVALADTIAIAKLQQVLSGHSRTINVESSAQTSFSDLQKGPIVLVSGFNNPWTMRLTGPLRFHLVRPAVDTFEIEDRSDPKRTWSVYTLAPLKKISEDYGLIARFHDPTTEQIVVVVAGIGENGTIAAAEALSDEQSMAELQKRKLLPSRAANFEAVVGVQMIDGKPGPPKFLATYTW